MGPSRGEGSSETSSFVAEAAGLPPESGPLELALPAYSAMIWTAPRPMLHRPLLLASGIVCMALATAGAFLPLLPTTPFLLLAAACFARSSERLHRRLMEHGLFGPILHDWERHRAIRTRVKVLATLLSAGMVAYPVFFLDLPLYARIAAAASVLLVIAFLWSRPTPA